MIYNTASNADYAGISDEEILGQKFSEDELAGAENPIDGHVTTMEGIQGKYQNGIFSGNPFVGFTAPDAVVTGFQTTDDEDIISSYGDDNDFYTQIELNDMIDNTPSGAMSYRGYLAYNGLKDPRIDYNDAVRSANDEYLRSLPGYGAGGEQLGRLGLNGSGYSEYFGGVAYANKIKSIAEAQKTRQETERQYGAQYAEYLKNYTPTETETIQKSAGVYASLLSAMPTTEDGIEAVRQAAFAEGYSTADIDAAILKYRNSNMGSAATGAIIDIYNQSGVNEAMLPAMRSQLKIKGYTDAQIDAAEKQWKEMQISAIKAGFTDVTSVGAATPEELQAAYGTGELYNAALDELQKKNGELINAALTAALQSGDINSPEIVKAFPALTGTEEWAKMDDDTRSIEFKKQIQALYDNGDINEETYHNANYQLRKNNIAQATEAGDLNDALESIYQLSKSPDEVSPEQKDELFKTVYDEISIGNRVIYDDHDNIDSTMGLYVNFKNNRYKVYVYTESDIKVNENDGTIVNDGNNIYIIEDKTALPMFEIRSRRRKDEITKEQREAFITLIKSCSKTLSD